MGFLKALITLVCISTPVCRAEGCSRLRNLDNGQTFFRYSGLLVIFRCRPGYKLHGHKTNSCVSGQWTRDPPLCVASGCSYPGPLAHGTSSMNEDGSWVKFSCDSGFRLHGPSMVYCKGHTWNSTKPVCKEADMMRSLSDLQRLNSYQDFFASPTLKIQQQSRYENLSNTASKDVDVKLSLLSRAQTQMSTSDRITTNNLKVTHQEESIQLPGFKVNEAQRPEKQSESHSAKLSGEEAETLDNESRMLASDSHLSASVSPTASSVSRTEWPTSSSPTSPAVTPSTAFAVHPFPLLRQNNFPLPVTEFQGLATSPNSPTPSGVTAVDQDQQGVSGSSSQALIHRRPEAKEASPNAPSTSAQTVMNKSSSSSNTSAESGSQWAENLHLSINTTLKSSVSLGGGAGCPNPPVPAHGTFYLRRTVNPGPKDYGHYVQYVCYAGYTLAHGDVLRYCQDGGTWSGTTPVCLELASCSANNGGCSQLCFPSQPSNHSSDPSKTRTQCHCRPGFALLEDGRSCGDVDECLLPVAVTGCVFGCVNTLGSFYCKCPAGYSLQSANDHCQDMDECAVNAGLGPCMELCHNSPGSYRCSCSYGRLLAGDGHSCVSACPTGYRQQPAAAPGNATAQTLRGECVDIDECLEDRCEGQCINLPGSHRCICPRGYTLQQDGQRCKDINECRWRNGGCSHVCVNRRGGYKCACPATHRLSHYSWKKCLPRITNIDN